MTSVAIIGASGYTGLELVKILLLHPHFTITYVGTSAGEQKLSQMHPSLSGVHECEVQKSEAKEIAKVADLAFLALPHKTAMGFAKELLDLGVKVVDLSADYRLTLETYEKHYCPHEDKKHLKDAVYGLPELYSEQIQKSSLVANPGCYPTAALLGLVPFCDYLKKDAPIFIDAKSAPSGAGKKLNELTQFITVNDNIFAYNPFGHRHGPEIKEKLNLVSGKDFQINFVPHLIPASRGMLVNAYVQLSEDIDAHDIAKEYYKNAPFVRLRKKPVDIKSTSGTNFCDMFLAQNERSLLIATSIDNLMRGASSQAVVNANLMCGYDENAGIPLLAYVP